MADDDRKYKQRGYQQEDRGQRSSSSGPPPTGADGRRPPNFAASREAVKCDECGAEISTLVEVGFESRCPKCEADLHTCRNCLHLEPSRRFECSQPVKEGFADKRAANHCEQFDVRRIRVKETTFSTAPAPDDARKAFDALFKKP